MLPELYARGLARRGHRPDRAQLATVAQLEELRQRLTRAARGAAGPWRRALSASGRAPPRRALPGIYLWGGVGRGKTWLLDLFHAALEVPAQRSHFHRLMQDVHARLAALRPLALADPLDRVAADIAAGTRVLCCDELQVGDIADAMLLAGLFGGLLAREVTLVLTSNTPPAGLYPGGLQRACFLPAIALAGREIALLGLRPGIAWFEFAALCDGPRATADYIELARQFHTLLVASVPVFDAARDDAARRFVALVDELYDRGVKLVLSAAAPPDRLYCGTRLASEFRRTASRLVEMQSHEYLARPHRP